VYHSQLTQPKAEIKFCFAQANFKFFEKEKADFG
jgi:hypothetical protein